MGSLDNQDRKDQLGIQDSKDRLALLVNQAPPVSQGQMEMPD